MTDKFDELDNKPDKSEEIYFEKFDLCAFLNSKIAVKMITKDGRYIVQVFNIRHAITIIPNICKFDICGGVIENLRSTPSMYFDDMMKAFGAEVYSVVIKEMEDNGKFNVKLVLYLPDNRMASVFMEAHEATALALEKNIPISVDEKALNQFDKYCHDLPRWFDAKQPYTREVLHATAIERLASIPKIELEYISDVYKEMEDYESAAILHKALNFKND
ncbi:MAG: bifunctional nuclease family protein [Prevotellaceae bacterium]|jgi:hypothetical protein|nr:bifunctional nuclease family protein [Prevotellaceae bacterium]